MDNSNQTPVTPPIPSSASTPTQNDLPISEIVTNLKSTPVPAIPTASPLQEVTSSMPVSVAPPVIPVPVAPLTPPAPPAIPETKSPLYEDPNQVKPPVA